MNKIPPPVASMPGGGKVDFICPRRLMKAIHMWKIEPVNPTILAVL
jgi:hypothetical protein